VKRSNRLVILVGVLLAVLAFVAIVILLNQRTTPEGEEAVPTTETVLVAVQDIAIGDAVTPDLVREEQIDPEAVQQTPLRSVTQVGGQPALLAIPEGAQVRAEAIGLGGGADIDISAMLQAGEKSVTFAVDRVTGVDFLVTPGDTIDIVVSQDVPAVQETADSAANTDPEAVPRFEPIVGLNNQRSVKAILQDKRVLYVSSTRAITPEPTEDTNQDGVIDENDEPGAAAVEDSVILIFAGTDEDAEIIKFAQAQEGSLTTVIRNADDDEVEATLGITLRRLVDDFGLLVPDVIQLEFEEAETPQ